MSSIPYKDSLLFADRNNYVNQRLAWLRGETPKPIYGEQYASLAFTELDTQATAADAKVIPGDINPYLTRMTATLALAMQRDVRYTYAGRLFMMSLGENNKLREDFAALAVAIQNAGSVS